jgi:uncharacterized repeat protein (TIGR03803 family)
VLYSFLGGSDGAIPFGNVVFDAAGNLYGTTSIGGHSHINCLAGCGTVFELTQNSAGRWQSKTLLAFDSSNGAFPLAGVALKPGETQTLTFPLGFDELSFWSPQTKAWGAEPGMFDVWAGEDSTAPLHAEFELTAN